MDMDLFFGLIGLGCGAYCLYSAYMMSKTGIICKTLLLDSETAKKKCKDTGNFLVEVIPPTYGLGIVTSLYGAITLIDVYVVECGIIMIITIVLSFLALVWFAMVTSKSKKKYFEV